MGVLAAALQYDKDFTWALQRINELGLEVSHTSSFSDVYDMYSGWLNPRKWHKRNRIIINNKLQNCSIMIIQI